MLDLDGRSTEFWKWALPTMLILALVGAIILEALVRRAS